MGSDETSQLDAALDVLYGASLAEFTKERTRLARELKAAGDVPGSKAIATATKPSISAWAINRLWRDHREQFDGLFEAAEKVREVTGGDVDEFRAATEALRTATAAMRNRAADALREGGHPPSETTMRRVGTTLSALAAIGSFEPDGSGRLVADRDPPGFGSLSDLELPAPRPRPPEKKTATKRDTREEEEERARRAAEREKAVAAARRALDHATEGRERAEKLVARRQAEIERAQAALDAANESHAEATATLEQATQEETAAERALRAAESHR